MIRDPLLGKVGFARGSPYRLPWLTPSGHDPWDVEYRDGDPTDRGVA